MTDAKKPNLAALSKGATKGRWCQFHPDYCDKANRYNLSSWDTSHDVSAVIGDTPYRVATFKHADDAAFAEALVNAYREGRLVEVDQ